MPSTGHSSMQALSVRSTQGWAMMYVTGLTLRTTLGSCGYTSHNTPSTQFHAHRRPVIRIASALPRHTWHGRRPRCLRLGGHTFSGGRREVDELQAGRRVVVRYSLDPGDTHSTSDALGLVTAVDEAG